MCLWSAMKYEKVVCGNLFEQNTQMVWTSYWTKKKMYENNGYKITQKNLYCMEGLKWVSVGSLVDG